MPNPEPLLNPRRGSATGSYGLPVPPDWMRNQAESRRGSRPTLSLSAAGYPGGSMSGRNSPSGPWPPNRAGGLSDKISPKVHAKKVSIPREVFSDKEASPILNGGNKDKHQKVYN